MSQQNVEAIYAAYDFLNRGDVERLVDLCAEDFQIDMSERVFNPNTYRGSDGIRRFYEGVGEVWESYHWDVEEALVADDDVVVAMLHCRAQGREDGPEVDWRVAWLWTFRDGTPISLRFYRDQARALEAAGLRE